jgi:septum formation inhibitor MinC
MDSANLALAVDSLPDEPSTPAALLRGTARGLEMVVNARASADAIIEALTTRLAEAPGFFRGSDVRIAVDDGTLAAGCLARLDQLAETFGLNIVEVTRLHARARDREAIPATPSLAAGSAPSPVGDFDDDMPTGHGANPILPRPPVLPAEPASQPVMLADSELTELLHIASDPELDFEQPTQTAVPVQLAASPEAPAADIGPRLVLGPVRSGVILEHIGHVIVFGDVNPGAEVRASGNIVVLGRMRGTAHAGIGQDVGFLLALRLEPQQIRIGRMVARAGDSDVPPTQAEIAYVTGDQIVVERYLGKLPRNLATSL